jgi:hypothetical protein
MGVPGNANALLLKSAAAGGAYQVQRSLRFNSADSAYLNRTPASAGNRKTWTWAGWVKGSVLGTQQWLFACEVGGSSDYLRFLSDNIEFGSFTGAVPYSITTTAVYRDPSAWMHVVAVFDSTNATASSRSRLYVNGSLITQYSSATYPSLNLDTPCINTANSHVIGGRTGIYFSGYLAEVHFIDGQALTPSSFTETDATTGQLIPKAYTGSYGTNGFKLNFSDNSTAAALGTDTSGNGNTWTVNNLSVTAGSGNDSLVDTPTSYGTDTGVGGSVRGNYATLNPLYGGPIPTNGNLDVSLSVQASYATISFATSKWYWELTATAAITSGYVGVMDSAYIKTDNNWSSQARSYVADGNKFNGSASAYGASWANGDVIGVAVDIDAGTIVFYKNGASQGTAFSDLSGKEWRPFVYATAGSYTMNFGQRAFAYTAPSGFKALCDTNLPTPVVAKPNTVMDVKTWTGNGTTQTISGLSFGPDFTWIKRRDGANSHQLTDTVRGLTKYLFSDATLAEETRTNQVTAVSSVDFSLGSDSAVNGNTATYVAWCWDAGTSTVTNTAGSITSQVRANPTAGFSIVSWTGNATTGSTVGHGLGVKPHFVITKNRTDVDTWVVTSDVLLGVDAYMYLNSTQARALIANIPAPTSTVLTLSPYNDGNGNGDAMIAYCFAPVSGYSNGFSYTGNGSTDGSFVYLGFRPRLILVKRTDTTGNWTLLDTAREGYNVDNDPLYPNLSDAEGTADLLDITSNGFKLRSTDASVNANTGTYVGFAWAETPFAYSRAR